MDRATLLSLSKADLVEMILVQAARIAVLPARIEALEARLNAPPKTPANSSTPPSRGQKPNLPDRAKKPRPSRPGITRVLAERPDRTIEATLAACPHCAHVLDVADQSDIHAYDHINLPAISPTIIRINRHRGVCPRCRKHVSAPAPRGFEPGSPFGPGLCALIIQLHVTQGDRLRASRRFAGRGVRPDHQ